MSTKTVDDYRCSCPGSWVHARDKCDHIMPLCIDGHCMGCGEWDPRGELVKFYEGKTRRTREEERKRDV